MPRLDPLTDPRVAVVHEAGLAVADVTGDAGQQRGAAMFRQAVERFGLDARGAGTARWNPLGALARQGATILVKPNWVHHVNPAVAGPIGLECLVTSPAFVLEAVRLAARAVGPDGRVVVGDSPIQGCDLDAVLTLHGLGDALRRTDFGAPVEIADFRRTRAVLDRTGYPVGQVQVPGDPAGYRVVRFDGDSRLAELDGPTARYAVSHYAPDSTQAHHGGGRHEYLLTATALAADLVVGLPKLKTHQKSAMTGCLKNLVGLNGNKEWLPHYRQGAPSAGGDEVGTASPVVGAQLLLERLETRLIGLAVPKQAIRLIRVALRRAASMFGVPTLAAGAWHGNDTLWRMVADLNRALLYADAEGVLCDTPRRRVFHVVDGLLAGEGDGPLRPTPKVAGLVLAGVSPVAVDWTACRAMGFDPARVPAVARAFDATRWPLASFRPGDVRGEGLPRLSLAPAPGWTGRIELEARR